MKKKYLKPAIILCLIAVLGIAGTLAYLTDETETLTNEFEVEDEIGIDLNETYEDFVLVPGEVVDKDPTITVTADSSYVFTKVVETIPTKALSDGAYTFADYVDYTINTGGIVYIYDEVLQTYTQTGWKWTLVTIDNADSVTDGTGTYEDGGAKTTVTYVYALTDTSGNLLAISSNDSADEYGDNPATFPILLNDKVTIPTTLTTAMLESLITESAADEADATYTVDLSFTGYAIQSVNIESGLSTQDIYVAAGGE